MDKIRIGVIGVAKVNQQKDEIRVMLKTMDEKLKKENNVEAFVCTEPLFNEALIQDTAKKMELDERVDVLVVIVGTWVFSSHVISAVNDLSIPFVLFGESEEIANGNFGASIQIRYVLQEMGKHFLYVYGSAEDERNINKILKYANAAHTMHSMKLEFLQLVKRIFRLACRCYC